MPVLAVRVREVREVEAALALAIVLEGSRKRPRRARDEDDAARDDALAELLVLLGAETITRSLRTTIGPARLSMARLRARERALGDAVSRTQLAEYRLSVGELQRLLNAWRLPNHVKTRGGHYFEDGEELGLLLIRRFVSLDPLAHLADETGRSEAAQSEAVEYVMQHLVASFPHCFDERSFLMWVQRFDEMAEAFATLGMPIDDCVLLIDGKLYPVCRPTRGQRACYNGHHKKHGVKCLGHVFANGLLPYAVFDPEGAHHDAHALHNAGTLELLEEASEQLGHDVRAGADSGFPVHRFCTPMFRGQMDALRARFNADYSPGRVTVEWGFRKVVALYPYVDYSLSDRMWDCCCRWLYF